jgi:hypothetical protein
MKFQWLMGLLAAIAIVAVTKDAFGQEKVPLALTGEKTSWHGFDRYDFMMDEANLTITPVKAGEKLGKGQLKCIVVVPKEAAAGKPWSWRGYYFDHEPQAEVELLKRGFHIGFVLIDAGKQWDAWYNFLTEKHGLSTKPCLLGMSRGGSNAFAWGTANPDKVSCIYADNTGVRAPSLAKFGELLKYDVPVLQVCGSVDPILGKNALVIESTYQKLGGRVTMMIKEGTGHHPHSLRDPTPIADFMVQSIKPSSSVRPAYVSGDRVTRTNFYSTESSKRDFPKEKLHITCRGPLFTECYDRYEFGVTAVEGLITTIVPKTAAAGKPWAYWAGPAGQDAPVDLALLAKGFHIVVGPANADGPKKDHWDAVYKHFIGHGFSKTPVMVSKKAAMEGARRAAGEVCAWATYKELGGQITVIIKEGEGRYSPTPTKDRQPVVDFLLKSAH